jgi:hypothetical protein
VTAPRSSHPGIVGWCIAIRAVLSDCSVPVVYAAMFVAIAADVVG